MLEHSLSKQMTDKLVLVDITEEAIPLVEYASRFEVPISLQNITPAHFEALQRRLLYEKGIAVSNSQIRPQDWQKGDLVLSFTDIRSLTGLAPQAQYLILDNASQGWAPAWEKKLQTSGAGGSLSVLAPILESYLFAQEKSGALLPDQYRADAFDDLILRGMQQGLWDPFLDNSTFDIYNTFEEN